jgi:hypothetical protein
MSEFFFPDIVLMTLYTRLNFIFKTSINLILQKSKLKHGMI